MQCLIFLTSLALFAQPAESASPDLKSQLEHYFRAPQEADRAKTIEELSETSNPQAVAAALPNLDLWSKPDSLKDWSIKLPSGQVVLVEARLPENYDGSAPIPLVISYPSASRSTEDALSKILAVPKLQQAWVVLNKPVGGSFYQLTGAAADMSALIRELHRKICVDVDRTYIFGENSGADSAWVAAIMCPHPFAALLAFSGYPHIPYPEQTYPLFLVNLRGTPFLAAWTQDPHAANPTPVQAADFAITQFGLAAGLNYQAATLAPLKPGVVASPAHIIAATLAKPRALSPQVDLWFRYLPQGDSGWLRATQLGGEVWDDEQISIVPTPGTDRDGFIAETIKEKMFHMSGRIEEQTITIDTHRIAALELRLSPQQVDLARPVTIIINGRKRFEGPLDASVKDLLETAYETWDFQHPVYAHKSFTINPRG